MGKNLQTKDAFQKDKEFNYRSLFENSVMGISQALPDGTLIRANAAYAQIYGYATPDEMMREVHDVGQLYADPGQREAVLEVLKEKGVLEPREISVIKRDGTLLTILEGAREIRDHEGNLVCYQAEHVDITEQKRAERNYLDSEQLFSKMFDQSPVTITITTPFEGRLIDVNETFLRDMEYTREEVIGKTTLELGIFYDLEERNRMVEGIKKDQYLFGFECRFRSKTGKILHGLMSVAFIKMKGQTYQLSTVIDITERKKAEERILQVDRIYAVISQINQAIVRLRDRETLLHEVCRIAIDFGKFRMAWVGMAEEESKLVKPVAYAGDEDGYLDEIVQIAAIESPRGNGPTGLAIRQGLHFVCDNIETDPRMTVWQEHALKRGYHSSIALPLKQFGKIVGALTLYADTTHFFDQQEITLLDEIADDLSFALEAIETEKKHRIAEEALRLSRKEFKTYFDSGSAGLSVTTPDKSWIEVNQRLCQMLGYTKAELTGINWLELTHPDDRMKNLELFQQAMDGKLDSYELDKRFFRKDGTIIYVTLSVACQRNDDGSMHHFLSSYIDITARKQFEEMIQRERIMLRTLMDNLPSPIYVLDKEGHKVIANKADVENIGFASEAEILGKNDLELFPGEIGKRGHADNLSVVQTGIPIIDCEENFFDKKGVQRWLLTSKYPLYDEQGKITGLVGLGHDITERKKTEAALIKAKELAEENIRLKSAFLANMSHEIRTPMNAIMGFSNLMAETEGSERDHFAGIVQKSSQQLLKVIDDVIYLSRLQSEKLPVNITGFRPVEMVNDVFMMFDLPEIKKGLALTTKIPAGCENLLIRSDMNKIKQVLSNLLSNALKYTQAGSVEVGFLWDAGRISFYVKDTGIGVTPQERDRIFETFYRGERALSAAIGGTGLGLNIAKELVGLLRGDIVVDSEVNHGSRFSFSLTVEYSYNTQAAQARPEAVQKTHQEINLLIAEDEPDNYLYLEILLRDKVNHIDHAFNGRQAVELASTNTYHLVLMDIKMPVMGGIEATRILKEKLPNLPVIAQTAYAMPEERENALKAGCDDYLVKPIKKSDLLEMIKKHTSTTRIEQP